MTRNSGKVIAVLVFINVVLLGSTLALTANKFGLLTAEKIGGGVQLFKQSNL